LTGALVTGQRISRFSVRVRAGSPTAEGAH